MSIDPSPLWLPQRSHHVWRQASPGTTPTRKTTPPVVENLKVSEERAIAQFNRLNYIFGLTIVQPKPEHPMLPRVDPQLDACERLDAIYECSHGHMAHDNPAQRKLNGCGCW